MFSNILSYGEGNLIRFKDPVTQLIGSNGAGKSSIPIILEEGLFNKNSKGIKKGDLLNKFSTKPTYNISIQFDVEQDHYFIKKEVGTTTKVTLFKNDEEITGHTTTQTYKLVEGVLGVDFPTFTKLVYQSMVSSLDFISATDSTR
jgi:DNA repair exonuclease SbcCD ATPase subunit